MTKNYFFDDKVEFVLQLRIGRSGSSLFESIVDGHSEVVVINKPFFFLPYYRKDKWGGVESLIKNTIKSFTEIDNKNKMYDLIFDNIIKYEFSDRVFFEALYYAYAIMTKKDLDKIKVIYIHCHSPEYYKKHYLDFPNAKTLVVKRHPVSSTYSFISLTKAKYRADILSNIYSFIFDVLSIKKLNIKENIKFFKLEDLYEDSHKVILNIVDYLNIKKEDILFKSTFNSKPFKERSVTNDYLLEGFDRKNYNNEIFKKYFTQKDIMYIETLTKEFIKEQDYEFYSKRLMSNEELYNYNFSHTKASIIDVFFSSNNKFIDVIRHLVYPIKKYRVIKKALNYDFI